jgi:hypothetical protein
LYLAGGDEELGQEEDVGAVDEEFDDGAEDEGDEGDEGIGESLFEQTRARRTVREKVNRKDSR